jgi:hypothetical protein
MEDGGGRTVSLTGEKIPQETVLGPSLTDDLQADMFRSPNKRNLKNFPEMHKK